MNDQQDEICTETYPPRKAQVGYLLIRTEYIHNGGSVVKNQTHPDQVNANGAVAGCVRKLVEDEGGFVRGAVVSATNYVADIIISYKIYPVGDDDPISRIIGRIHKINIDF